MRSSARAYLFPFPVWLTEQISTGSYCHVRVQLLQFRSLEKSGVVLRHSNATGPLEIRRKTTRSTSRALFLLLLLLYTSLFCMFECSYPLSTN